MKIRRLIFTLLLFVSYGVKAQEPAGFDGHNWKAPYHLPVPEGWHIERFLLPASFAPQIQYKGVEDIRFTPGWAKKDTEEYWTYAFLWYLESKPVTNAGIISENLNAYYTGLFRINTDSTKIPAEKIKSVITELKKITAEGNDLETYSGTIDMMDYMTIQPIRLYCKVRVQNCKDAGRSMIFYELSPQPFTHLNWKKLDNLWSGFKCTGSNP